VAFVRADYDRRIELLSADLSTVVAVLSDKTDGSALDVVENAEFTLLRQGGCGPGSFKLDWTSSPR